MKFKEKLSSSLFHRILQKNEPFKNIHKDETCYIIGNGASLKNMDLSAFSNHITIGVNNLVLHSDFQKLDVRYHVLVEPLFLYPYCKNPYTKKIQENIFGKLFKKSFSQYPQVNLFVSITNILGSNLSNIYYLYHFGHREPDMKQCDISGTFSFMAGGLYGAIGLAINMGFRKAILVGCDYVFTPICDGHFYGLGPGERTDKVKNIYEKLFNEVEGAIELSVITDVGVSKWLPSQTYKELTGKNLKYHENNEIIKKEYLDILKKAVELKQFDAQI